MDEDARVRQAEAALFRQASSTITAALAARPAQTAFTGDSTKRITS